jgi:hypothetical protein
MNWQRACAGGSGATLTRRGAVAHKRALSVAEAAKLSDELTWLRQVRAALPESAASMVLRALDGESAEDAIATEWVSGPSLRLAVADGDPAAVDAYCDIARLVFGQILRLEIQRDVGRVQRWCEGQIERRLAMAVAVRPHLREVLAASYVAFDDGTIENPYRNVEKLIRTIRPPLTGVVHGDLHMGNVILSESGPVLIDPRGSFDGVRTFDPAYDLAKILHEPQYVVARGLGRRTRLQTVGNTVTINSEAQLGPFDRERLARLRAASLAAAAAACGEMRHLDPDLAARATLYTGLLFLTMLPFATLEDGEWQTLLGYGFMWAHSGIDAVESGLGTGGCSAQWRGLLEDDQHTSAGAARHALRTGMRAG